MGTGSRVAFWGISFILLFSGSAWAEQRSGRLLKMVRENFRDFHEEFLRIQDAQTGEEIDLSFDHGKIPDRIKNLRSGSLIRVNGKRSANTLQLSGDASSFQVLQSGTGALAGSTERVLVLTGNYADKAIECSMDQIRSFMFSDTAKSVTNLYKDSSYGAVTVTGDVVGPYNTTLLSTGTCDTGAWTTQLEAAAKAAGVVLSNYTRRMYVVPRNASCGWAGLATITGTQSWNNYCWWDGVYAHELGHNFGMYHASTPTSEYGDGSDFMGNQGTFPVNSAHREQMRWLPTSQVASFTGAGTYELSTIDLDPTVAGRPQALKIPKTDTHDYYYLSVRHPYGFSSGMSASYTDRLNIHEFSSGNTMLLSTLGDTQTFTDAANGLAITLVAHTADTVTVQISAQCVAAAPGLSLSPASQGARPGETKTYSFTLTNRDSGLCGASTFNVSFGDLSGGTLSGSLGAASLALSPGQSGSVQVSVTATSGAVDGSYAFKVSASDPAAVSHAGFVQGTLSIDSTAPTVPTGLQASVSGKTVNLAWAASADNLRVAGYRVFRNGLLIGQTTGTTFSNSPGTGTFSYAVSAIDDAGNASALSTPVSVTIARGGGKKR